MKSVLVLTAVTLLLAGCSSVPTEVDTGAVTARTFSFLPPPPRPMPAYADTREHVHTLIQQAITTNLAAKGVSRVEAGGDMVVAYLVIVGNNAATTSLNDYFGYDRGATELVDKVHSAQTVKGHTPYYFEAGTLVIDILDGQTFKLRRRATAQRPILRNLPDDARAARIQEVVDQVLKDLRITG